MLAQALEMAAIKKAALIPAAGEVGDFWARTSFVLSQALLPAELFRSVQGLALWSSFRLGEADGVCGVCFCRVGVKKTPHPDWLLSTRSL